MVKFTALTVLVICYSNNAFAGGSSSGLASTFEDQSSFPLLPSSEVPSLPSYNSKSSPLVSDSQLQTLSLNFFENAYLTFASSMGTVFSHTATNVYAETAAMYANMTKIEQLYATPTLIKEFVPLFDALARDFSVNSDDLSKVPAKSMLLAPQQYIYCTTPVLKEYIQSIKDAGTGANAVSSQLTELIANVKDQLKSLKLSHKKKRIFLTVPAANAIDANIKAIIASSEQMQNALESIVTNGLPIRKYQTSLCAQNFLGAKFTFLSQLNASFNQLMPVLSNFAAAFLSDGKITKKNQFAVKISKINYQSRATANGAAHYIRILGDYFEMFTQSLQYMQKNQQSC